MRKDIGETKNDSTRKAHRIKIGKKKGGHQKRSLYRESRFYKINASGGKRLAHREAEVKVSGLSLNAIVVCAIRNGKRRKL